MMLQKDPVLLKKVYTRYFQEIVTMNVRFCEHNIGTCINVAHYRSNIKRSSRVWMINVFGGMTVRTEVAN